MKDIFLSDAHLIDPADPNYRRLLAFLAQERGSIRTLYLLGDIFEFWIGYRHAVFAPYVPLLELLRQLHEDGVELVCVEGNHDFHLGPYFRETLGATILPDGGIVEIDGLRVYLGHGDLINPEDRGYRLLRRLLRSAPARLLLPLIHPGLAWRIARRASRASKTTHKTKQVRWNPRELILAHADRRFIEGCHAVITGHFHTPFLQPTNAGTVIALGDWITQFSYATLEDGKFTLHSF